MFTQQSEEDVTENNGLINDVEENAQDNNGNPRVKHFLDLTPSEREVLDEVRICKFLIIFAILVFMN